MDLHDACCLLVRTIRDLAETRAALCRERERCDVYRHMVSVALEMLHTSHVTKWRADRRARELCEELRKCRGVTTERAVDRFLA